MSTVPCQHDDARTRMRPRTIPGWRSTLALYRTTKIVTSDSHHTKLGYRTNGYRTFAGPWSLISAVPCQYDDTRTKVGPRTPHFPGIMG